MAQLNKSGVENTLPSKYIYVNNTRLHYVEDGNGSPVLFLHGIPANLYLWRNVMPIVAASARAIALDLAGFGKSDVPVGGGYDADNQYLLLEGFIREMRLANLTLVVTDLGSVLGLRYASLYPANIKGIVLMEGMMMPAYEFYMQLPLMQKMMYAMFRNRWLATALLVNGSRVQRMIVPAMTIRKLSAAEKAAYAAPYRQDVEKKKVIADGPGPVDFPKKDFLKPGRATRQSVVMMNENAARLSGTNIPMLILYARPGFIITGKALEYAKAHYPNLSLQYIGAGKHFLPEDNPEAIGKAIGKWLKDAAHRSVNSKKS